jgi:hypothetical protein
MLGEIDDFLNKNALGIFKTFLRAMWFIITTIIKAGILGWQLCKKYGVFR